MMRLLNFSVKVTFTGGADGYGVCVTGGTLGCAEGSVASVGVDAGVGSGAGVGSFTLRGAIVFLYIVTIGAAWAVVTAGLGFGVGATESVSGGSDCSGVALVQKISDIFSTSVVAAGPYSKNGISGAGLRIIVMIYLIELVALSCDNNSGIETFVGKNSTVS